MSNKKVAVLGLGNMGHGIAQVSAMSGYEVLALDVNDEFDWKLAEDMILTGEAKLPEITLEPFKGKLPVDQGR